MNVPSAETPVLPSRPGLFSSLVAGFDAIANNALVILFPIIVDLGIWFGPHLRLKTLVLSMLTDMEALYREQNLPLPETFPMVRELWLEFAERYNLLSLLRTFPIGVPSLMSGRLPLESPWRAPLLLDITAPLAVLGYIFLLPLMGIIVGVFYSMLVARVSVEGQFNWRDLLSQWPYQVGNMLLLTLMMLLLAAILSIPLFCVVSLFALGGLALGPVAGLLYMGLLAWWLFPLFFSAHGIILYGEKAYQAIRRSINVVRQTFVPTAWLVLIIFLLSQGLDLLWNTPKDNSWLLLIGIAGHAFISTGLLAASFIYYRDINRWMHDLLLAQGRLAASAR